MQVSFGLSSFSMIHCLIRVKKIFLLAFFIRGYAHVSILSQGQSEVCHTAVMCVSSILKVPCWVYCWMLWRLRNTEPWVNTIWSKPLTFGKCYVLQQRHFLETDSDVIPYPNSCIPEDSKVIWQRNGEISPLGPFRNIRQWLVLECSGLLWAKISLFMQMVRKTHWHLYILNIILWFHTQPPDPFWANGIWWEEVIPPQWNSTLGAVM